LVNCAGCVELDAAKNASEVSVGRRYAGVLGLLAFVTVLTRGLVHGAAAEPTLLAAAVNLFAFAFIGYIVGQVAGWIVLDSVRSRLAGFDE
jgi:hypothetical protein